MYKSEFYRNHFNEDDYWLDVFTSGELYEEDLEAYEDYLEEEMQNEIYN